VIIGGWGLTEPRCSGAVAQPDRPALWYTVGGSSLRTSTYADDDPPSVMLSSVCLACKKTRDSSAWWHYRLRIRGMSYPGDRCTGATQ
jgi:hypothetical protein